MYIGIQESIARKHFAKWLGSPLAKNGKAQPIMMTARYLNMDTSLRVFCGNHLSEEAALEINDKYWAITQSLELVNFPLALPGTKVYKAIQARKRASYWLELAANRSKKAMAAGAEPECMLDEWVNILNDPSYKGKRDYSDREMAMVLFSFLFASQDAMSSGLIYAFQHLSDSPDILAKIRAEQDVVRQGNYEKPLTLEMIDQMAYLTAFVKESMRMKPPVTMVCCISCSSFSLHSPLAPRFPTRPPRRSPYPKTIPSPLTAWSSPHSTTPCMTHPSIPNLRNFTLNAGWNQKVLLTRTLKITFSLEAGPIGASVLNML